MSSITEKFIPPKKLQKCSTNIWTQFTKLVAENDPLNLGIGFPDYLPQEFVTNALVNVATSENCSLHQYTRDHGHIRLVQSVSRLYSILLHREIDHQKEVLIAATGCQALYISIMGLVEEGDEVIIVEPYFDFYGNLVNMAGGKCRFIPLRSMAENQNCSSQWSLDIQELQNVFNSKTKLFILNTPNNPLGKVFNLEELTLVADLCKKWNVLCIADEVYEFFIYEPNAHVRIASLPGMWERTVTVCCPGKTFGVTGWELGILYGAEKLISNLKTVIQHLIGSSCTPIQEAFAILFENEIARLNEDECIFNTLRRQLQDKRDFMVTTLIENGIRPIIPEGGFFIISDWSSGINPKTELRLENNETRSFDLTKWLIENEKLAGIPLYPFYHEGNKHLGENYIRFCFYKKTETLKKFAHILKEWRGKTAR